MGHQARQAHQEDVPHARPKTLNAFLCRDPLAPTCPGVDLRNVQIAARHADPRTTMRYDRARKNLDRHPNYILRRLHGLRHLTRPSGRADVGTTARVAGTGQPGCLSRRLLVAGRLGWPAIRVHPPAGAHPRYRRPDNGDHRPRDAAGHLRAGVAGLAHQHGRAVGGHQRPPGGHSIAGDHVVPSSASSGRCDSPPGPRRGWPTPTQQAACSLAAAAVATPQRTGHCRSRRS